MMFFGVVESHSLPHFTHPSYNFVSQGQMALAHEHITNAHPYQRVGRVRAFPVDGLNPFPSPLRH